MDFLILFSQVILKMTLSLVPGLVIIFGCLAITTEVKKDKTWLRKVLNKYILGVE